MTLRDLAVRLKKSVSGLFPPFNEGNTPSYEKAPLSARVMLMSLRHDPVESSPKDTQDVTLDLEDFGPRRCHINHSCPDFKRLTSTNSSPLKRGRLLGTLRKGSLRSIASFRNLRSPSTRFKQPDHPAQSTPEEVCLCLVQS